MSNLDSEARQFHEKLRNEYLEYLRKNEIKTCKDYFHRLGLFEDGTIRDSQSVPAELNDGDYPLDIFYRLAPTKSQDVMMTTLNPSMESEIELSTFTEGEYQRHQQAGSDLEAKAETVALNLHKYLTRDNNSFSFVIDTLRNQLDLMDGSGSLKEYLEYDREGQAGNFFDEVCYTYPYKLATPKDYHVDELGGPSREAARNAFAEELFEVVEPKLLICVGKQGWQTVWNYLDDPEDEIVAYSEKSPVTKSYQRKLGKGAFSGLYRLESEDLWIITTFHASRGVDRDRLEKHAKILNDHLTS